VTEMSSLQLKTDPPTAAEVDELGELQAWLARKKSEIQPKSDREKELSDKIAACFDSSPAESEFEVKGNKFVALVSPRGNRREIIDIKKLYKALTPTIFYKICSVPLGKLDALLDEAKQKGFVRWGRTAPRSVKVVLEVEE
jgi:hypothetical protein